MLSALALKPEESSWKQQSRTGLPCVNSPRSTLALASYNRTVLSHEETSRWSLWLEKRRLETPSAGGLESSRPEDGGGTAVIAGSAEAVAE